MLNSFGDNALWPPNYVEVYKSRAERLLRLRASPEHWAGAKEFYKTRPVDFIEDWGTTYDPRIATSEIPARLPFILFRRQKEFITFLWDLVRAQENGLIEKSRDIGATWLSCAFSTWLWRFHEGSAIGWGSRKEQLVDKIGDPDSIFEKMRILITGWPRELWPIGFNQDCMTYMKIINPENGATITGEAGDNIGRGGRKLIFFKDESSHYERPEKIEAALSDNTRCQLDISSVNGLGNVFHRRREAGIEWTPESGIQKGRTNVFIFDWQDHPLKTKEWYDERRARAVAEGLLHLFAQEVDRDYAAAIEGVIIPAPWVVAAVDAHLKLGFDDSGLWGAALDVADGGGDLNALAVRKGVILKSVDQWGERDTGVTTRRAVDACKSLQQGGVTFQLQYDCIGVGSGVKAEANRLFDERLIPKTLQFVPWNAAASVLQPDSNMIPGDPKSPKNKDFYDNLKAQAWWNLRLRFERTWRAINEPGFTWKPDQLISLPSSLPLLRSLQKELSQATASSSTKSMKLVIDKTPEGTRSPNLADAVVMAFWPVGKMPMIITDKMLAEAARPVRY